MSEAQAQPPAEATASSSSQEPAGAAVDPVAARATVLALINEARAKASGGGVAQGGFKPLKLSDKLNQAAQEHAADMAQKGYFDYNPPGGGDGVEARVRKLEYKGRTGYNLSRNRVTPEEAVLSWFSDPTTTKGILDPDHRELGLGTQGGYWVLLLGSLEEEISEALREMMRDIINERRKAYSMPLLELNRQLNYIAQMHSLDMAARKFFEHISPDGKDPEKRAKEAGFTAEVFELISDIVDPAEAFKEWQKTPAWRSQLVSERNRCLGVGLFAGKWTVVLGLPPATSGPPQKTDAELKTELSGLVNKERTNTKAPPLKPNPTLEQIVEGHATDMAEKDFLAYEHPGVLGIPGRIKESGYKGRTFPAITKGQGTADAVVKLFMSSEGHRKQLLDPDYREIGLTVKNGAWVILLGAPPAEASGDMRTDFLRILNAERTASGVPPLALSSLLNHVAQDYAQDMVRRDFFAFNNPEGKGPHDLAKLDGFPGRIVPSLARGHSTSEAVLGAWLKNPQQRTNLLDPQYSALGIGVAESRWVLLLGTPST